MLYEVATKIAEHEAAAQSAEHAGEHAGGGSEFIMHHILAHPVIKLPTVFGVDLTITNHVIMMWVVAAVLLGAFYTATRRRSLVPHGLTNLLESIVAYLRDDIILPNLGENSKRFAPYLLTAFFFILLANLFGLVPGGSTATGNIGVTTALALLTLIVGQAAAIRKHGLWGYIKHFIPPGLPAPMIVIMFPVEVMSLLAKHVALSIRLFANMIAGHITILAIMSLIFIFKSWLVAPLPFGLIIFCALLEVLIALIQAYVFTILSAVFIRMAISEEH